MWTAEINYAAMIVAALVPMSVGFAWYSLRVFGTAWARLIGKTPDQIQAEGNMVRALAVSIVGSLVTAYLLALIVALIGAEGFGEGFVIGIWGAIGLVATAFASSYVYENRPLNLYLINAGYHVVTIPLMAGILSVWS